MPASSLKFCLLFLMFIQGLVLTALTLALVIREIMYYQITLLNQRKRFFISIFQFKVQWNYDLLFILPDYSSLADSPDHLSLTMYGAWLLQWSRPTPQNFRTTFQIFPPPLSCCQFSFYSYHVPFGEIMTKVSF